MMVIITGRNSCIQICTSPKS